MGDETATAGVLDAQALALSAEGTRQCGLGFHAWTPWLGLPSPEAPNRYVALCGRECCEAHAQYDL